MESTHRAYGNAGKWIDFLPVEGHEILIHTSFLTVSNTLTANMRVPACVCLGLCLHICRLMESKRNVQLCVRKRSADGMKGSSDLVYLQWYVTVFQNTVGPFTPSVEMIPEITWGCLFLWRCSGGGRLSSCPCCIHLCKGSRAHADSKLTLE